MYASLGMNSCRSRQDRNLCLQSLLCKNISIYFWERVRSFQDYFDFFLTCLTKAIFGSLPPPPPPEVCINYTTLF